MRMFLGLIWAAIIFSSCKKSGQGSIPQLEFSDLKPDFLPKEIFLDNSITSKDSKTKIFLKLKDNDGDLGYIPGKDTSMVYYTTLVNDSVISALDSLIFPDLSPVSGKMINSDIVVNLYKGLIPSRICPLADSAGRATLYFKVFVKDFAGNKSNVIDTRDYDAPLTCLCE